MFSLVDERQRRLVLDSLWLGVIGGAAANIFIFMLDVSKDVFLKGIAGYQAPGLPSEGGQLVEVVGSHGLWLIPLVTALGGLISGVLVYWLAPQADGDGTDGVVHSFHKAGGAIAARVPPLKAFTSAVIIGSGGATGREGPAASIVAGLGSVYADFRHRSEDERRMLILIGMAAGLSAVFKTPIGAAIFAIEVLYFDMEFETGALLYTTLASVVAYTITGAFSGWEPLFVVASDLGADKLGDYLEYAVLGVAGGAVGAIMPYIFYKTRETFLRIPIPNHVKPAIGGLFVGLIALQYPQILASGYGWIQDAIDGHIALGLLFALIFVKIIAMSLTVASGGSGGVFAPSLFVGAMLGGVMAKVFHQSSAAFVMVGMAAVFSGAGRVPIATLLMVPELTGGYHLLPPAALVVTLSYLVQDSLTRRTKYKSLYEAQIPTRSSRDIDLLEGVTVEHAMTRHVNSVPKTMPLKELAKLFEKTHHHGFMVLNEDGKLYGVVSLGDLERAIVQPDFEKYTVNDVTTTDGLAIGYPDESVSVALWRMGLRRIGRLPIVSRKDDRELVGVLRREDIIRAYEEAIASRKEASSRLRELREAHEGNIQVLEADIGAKHPFVGQSVREIAAKIPDDCILVSIRRDKRVIIPHGNTIIQSGDHLVTIASKTCVADARRALQGVDQSALPPETPTS